MKALVTGASGFLGVALCKALCEKGVQVNALLRPTSDKSDLGNVTHHIGDVTDKDSFLKAAQGVDVVFHLAGLVGHSNKQLSDMQQVNVHGTQLAIEVCQKQNCKLIYISSVVAVGASKKPEVLNEDSFYDPSLSKIAYFSTKKQAEILVQNACKKGKLFAVILNPSTIYGDGDMKKGSRKIQAKVAKGKFPFYTSGGVSVVDLSSVVNACIVALEKGRNKERYILSGENITIKELFYLIAKAADKKPPFIHLNNFLLNPLAGLGTGLNKLGVPFPITSESAKLAQLYHWFDHSKATTELGFSPLKASKAVEHSVKWYLKFGTTSAKRESS